MSSTYTFKRETTVVIEYCGTLYYLDALGDYTYSQTFNKRRITRKTLHSKTPKPMSVITGKNPGSCTLQVYGADTFSEAVLFDLTGLEDEADMFILPYTMQVQPEFFNIYIISNSSVTRLNRCALTSLDTSFSKRGNITFDTSITFSDIQNDVSLPAGTQVLQGNVPNTTNELVILSEYGGPTFDSVKSTSFSIQQQYDWRQDNNLQTIGTTYVPTVAILTDMPINAVISAYYNSTSILPDIMEHIELSISFGIIRITLTDIQLTKRVGTEDVLEVQYDLSLQETSSVTVEYGAIT